MLRKRSINDASAQNEDITPTTADSADLPSAQFPIAVGDPPAPGAISMSDLLAYLRESLASGVVGDPWLTSASLVDGDLSESGTLAWTVATGAPTGVADGANTQCVIPLLPPDAMTFGWHVALLNSSDNVVDVVMGMWGNASEDINYFLKLDSTSFVKFTFEDIVTNTITPTFTFSITNTDNDLTGHYLTISPLFK